MRRLLKFTLNSTHSLPVLCQPCLFADLQFNYFQVHFFVKLPFNYFMSLDHWMPVALISLLPKYNEILCLVKTCLSITYKMFCLHNDIYTSRSIYRYFCQSWSRQNITDEQCIQRIQFALNYMYGCICLDTLWFFFKESIYIFLLWCRFNNFLKTLKDTFLCRNFFPTWVAYDLITCPWPNYMYWLCTRLFMNHSLE